MLQHKYICIYVLHQDSLHTTPRNISQKLKSRTGLICKLPAAK